MVVASFHLVRFRGTAAARRVASVPVDRRRLTRIAGVQFGKLLGTGRGRTMTTSADLGRWAVFATWDDADSLERFQAGGFAGRWHDAVERYDVTLQLLGAHGTWGGVDPLAGARAEDDPDDDPGVDTAGPVAVLTRATVDPRRLPAFLRAVPAVDAVLDDTDGLLAAVGIGEVPVGRQATFSLWRDATAVRTFAYDGAEHAEVVDRTRSEGWYGEEWFARFRPIAASGTWDGVDPLAGTLT